MKIELSPILMHRLPYDESWLYCLTLSHNNHKDWRLPTYDEAGNKYYKLIPHTCWVDNDYPQSEPMKRFTQPIRNK